ncbi:MAG: porin, partial [Vicinamibacterales bacterium]
MKKKLLAVAVAGALAAPGLALAQSSVTISGIFKVSLDNQRIGSPVAARAGTNTSETRIADDSSRVIFNVVEDLGGGLQAIAQLDWRIQFDQGQDAISGNNHVGLRSKSMGRIFVGRQDLHYFNRESNLTDLAGSLKADSISLLA